MALIDHHLEYHVEGSVSNNEISTTMTKIQITKTTATTTMMTATVVDDDEDVKHHHHADGHNNNNNSKDHDHRFVRVLHRYLKYLKIFMILYFGLDLILTKVPMSVIRLFLVEQKESLMVLIIYQRQKMKEIMDHPVDEKYLIDVYLLQRAIK